MEQPSAPVSNAAPSTTQPQGQAQQQATPQLHEFDIDGQKIPADKLIETYKKADGLTKSAYKKHQEAAAIRKEAEKFLAEKNNLSKRFKEDFAGLAREHGVDPLQLAEMVIRQEHENLSMTDEQRRLRELENENKTLKQIEAEKRQREEEQAQKDFEYRVGVFVDHHLGNAFKNNKITPNGYKINAAALIIEKQVQQHGVSIEEIDFDRVAQKAERLYQKHIESDPLETIKKYAEDEKYSEHMRKILLEKANKIANTNTLHMKQQPEVSYERKPQKKFYSPTEFDKKFSR